MWRAPRAEDKGAPERRRDNDRFRKKYDPVNRLYKTAAWERFRDFVRNRNPVCQKLIKGEQCSNGSWVMHHLLSPRQRPDLFLDPHNVVCLCERCHPGGTEGTPGWRPGIDYVPSIIEPPICV